MCCEEAGTDKPARQPRPKVLGNLLSHSTEPVGAGSPAKGPVQVEKVYLTDAAVARSQASNERISSLISSLSVGT